MVSISACHAEEPGSIPGGGIYVSDLICTVPSLRDVNFPLLEAQLSFPNGAKHIHQNTSNVKRGHQKCNTLRNLFVTGRSSPVGLVGRSPGSGHESRLRPAVAKRRWSNVKSSAFGNEKQHLHFLRTEKSHGRSVGRSRKSELKLELVATCGRNYYYYYK